MSEFTHIDSQGNARMVDVGSKPETERTAVAGGTVRMRVETLKKIMKLELGKGDVMACARIAGIMAAKRTGDLIPLCHPIPLTSVEVHFVPNEGSGCLDIVATARTIGRTGVEMEAMTAVAVAGLTVYDMCKAVDRGMEIGSICLHSKTGGKSGTYARVRE